jgi:DNA-binding response OmpR family regulator
VPSFDVFFFFFPMRQEICAAASARDLKAAGRAKASKADKRSLTFLPGAIVYGGHRKPLKGKAWEVLKALADAPGRTLTLRDLLRKVWGVTVIGEDTVRRHIYSARQALRKAMKAAGVTAPADPIPAVDRGTDRTAWYLDLP